MKPIAIAFLILSVFSLVFFQNVLAGKTTFVGWVDNIQQYYFWSQFAAQEIHQGRFPIVVPFAGAGMFFPGELQHAPFYPIALIWYIIFGNDAGISQYYLDLLIILHSVLGGMAMAFLARTLSVSFFGCILAGLLFGFSGNFLGRADDQANIFFCLTYVPLILGCWIQFLKDKKMLWCWLSGLGLGLSLLAGHFVGVVFAFLACLIFTGLNFKSILKSKKILPVFFGSAVLAFTSFCTAFVQLIPSYLYQKNSLRWVELPEPVTFGQKLPYDLIGEKYRIHFYHLLQFLDPGLMPEADNNVLYFGLVPLLLIGFYFYFKKHIDGKASGEIRQSVTFACILFGAGLLLAFGRMTPVHYLVNMFPFFSNVRAASRYLFLSQIAGVILCAHAVDFFIGHKEGIGRFIQQSRLLVIVSLGALCTLIWIRFSSFTTETHLFRVFELSILFLLGGFIYYHVSKKQLLHLILLILVVTNIYAYRNQYSRPNTVSLKFPLADEVRRIVHDSRIVIDESVPYEILPRNIAFSGKLNVLTTYGATMPVSLYAFLAEDWKPEGLSYDRFSVQYYVTSRPGSTLPLVYSDPSQHIFIHKRPNALPEVYSVDASAAYSALLTKPNEMVYNINMEREGDVTFALLHHPGWRGEVDGRPHAFFATGGLNKTKSLIGLHLEKGEHRVRLYFPFMGIFSVR